MSENTTDNGRESGDNVTSCPAVTHWWLAVCINRWRARGGASGGYQCLKTRRTTDARAGQDRTHLRCVSMSRPASRYALRDIAGQCHVLSRCHALVARGLYQPLACSRGQPAAAGALRMVRKARTPSAFPWGPEPERSPLGPSCLTGGSTIF
jgi:hypothetical protein